MQSRATKTSLRDAKPAVTSVKLKEEKEDPSARCSMRFAQPVETLARFLSSLARISLYIAVSALKTTESKAL